MEKEVTETKEKKGKNGKLILIVFLLLCIAVLAYVCYRLYMSRQVPVEDDSGDAIVVTEDTRDALGDINRKVEKGKISVRMTQNWVFEDGGKKSNAYLANSKRNSYVLRFKITLADSGKVIMKSPDVPVGSCIENFPLSVHLEPGEYNVIIAHQQVEDGKVINTVQTADTITVK